MNIKTIQEHIDELKKAGYKVTAPEKKFIGKNPTGSKFYEGDRGYFFAKESVLSTKKYSVLSAVLRGCPNLEANGVYSMTYKTYQEAFWDMLEYAVSQGDIVEHLEERLDIDYGQRWTPFIPKRENILRSNKIALKIFYRVVPSLKKEFPAYRAYTMEDDREKLWGAWIKPKGGNFEMQINFMSDARLVHYFQKYTFLDGSVIGVRL